MDKHNKRPTTVHEAVELLIEELSFGDRTIIANMKEEDLGILDFAIGIRLKGELGSIARLWQSSHQALPKYSPMAV